MSTTNTQSLDFNDIRQGKYSKCGNQLKTIFQFLKENTATASMVSFYTGVPQKSITRYKRDLEKQGLLYEVEKKLCEITKHRAWYLTTNPEKFPTSNLNTKGNGSK
jgi:hypothetical protein